MTIIDGGPATDVNALNLIDSLPTDITFHRLNAMPSDLVLMFNRGGSVTLQGYFNGGGVSQVLFSDGTLWTRADLNAQPAPFVDFPPPRALNDINIVFDGAIALLPAAGLLVNDAGTGLQIISVSNPSTGTVTVTAAGDVLLTAPANFTGTVTFNYTISDVHGETATAQASVTLLPGAAPTAGRDSFANLPGSTPVAFAPSDLLGNDTAAPGRMLSIKAVGAAIHGQAALDATGHVVFTPGLGICGSRVIHLHRVRRGRRHRNGHRVAVVSSYKRHAHGNGWQRRAGWRRRR